MTQPFASSESHPLNALRRTGIVQDASTASTGYVQVSLGDDDPTYAVPMTWVDTYKPMNGDSVLIVSTAGDNIIVGSLASIGLNSMRGYIDAWSSGGNNVPNTTYTEMAYDSLSGGGSQANGQAYIDVNGKIALPRTGLWLVVANVRFPQPATSYGRTIVITARTGLGSSVFTSTTRVDSFQTTVDGHFTASSPLPQIYNAGDTVTAYVWQDCGSTVNISPTWSHIVAYQVA